MIPWFPGERFRTAGQRNSELSFWWSRMTIRILAIVISTSLSRMNSVMLLRHQKAAAVSSYTHTRILTLDESITSVKLTFHMLPFCLKAHFVFISITGLPICSMVNIFFCPREQYSVLSIFYCDVPGVKLNVLISIHMDNNPTEAITSIWLELTIHGDIWNDRAKF